MVGVPGRSKACHTCRQRRIRCGGERPKCDNCVKSGRLCTGYQRNHAFVLSKDMGGLQANSSKTRLIEKTECGTVLVTRWRKGHDMFPPATRSSPVAGVPVDPYLDYTHGITPQHALRDQLLSIFIQTHLPKEPGSSATAVSRNFLLQVAGVPDITPALEYAMLAVCTVRLGRMNGQEDLTHRSLLLYTQALQELQQAVSHPATRYRDQTLATCMALTMYEFLECPGKEINGYNSHIVAAMHLLRVRGAEAHAAGLGHSIFFALRMHGFFYSLSHHEPIFLSNPEWCTLPYGSTPKGLYDDLVDILLDLPELFNRGHIVDHETHIGTIFTQTLESTELAWRSATKLRVWLTRFEASVAGPLYIPELSTLPSAADNPQQGKLFPVAFRFTAFVVAQAMVLYWIAETIVFSYLCKLYELLQRISTILREMGKSPCSWVKDENGGADVVVIDAGEEGAVEVPPCACHFRPHVLPPLGHRAHPRASMLKICQSVEYFLQDGMGSLGSSLMLPALLISRDYLNHFDGDHKRERVWINEMLQRIGEKGCKMAPYL